MTLRSNFTAHSRLMFLTSVTFITCMMLFTAHGWSQQPTQERPVWDVQLASNAQASSNITIQNQCKLTHTFTITEQQTPYLQLLASSTVTVPGNGSYNLPVRFNTSGMNPGVYQGTVLVKCETCRKERTCQQDREILPVRLTISQDNVKPGTPTPPDLVAPPVIAGPPGAKGNVTPVIAVPGYDPETKKKVDKIEFSTDIENPCKKQSCGEIQTVEKGKDAGNIYCPEVSNCGGDDCPKAGCHMLEAWKDKKDERIPKGLKDPDKWRLVGGGVGEKNSLKPNAGRIYGCGCR
jgi:hypothetical protein